MVEVRSSEGRYRRVCRGWLLTVSLLVLALAVYCLQIGYSSATETEAWSWQGKHVELSVLDNFGTPSYSGGHVCRLSQFHAHRTRVLDAYAGQLLKEGGGNLEGKRVRLEDNYLRGTSAAGKYEFGIDPGDLRAFNAKMSALSPEMAAAVRKLSATTWVELNKRFPEEYCPIWSADGSHVRFISWSDGTKRWWVTRAAVMHPVNTTIDGDVPCFWSPRANRALVLRKKPGGLLGDGDFDGVFLDGGSQLGSRTLDNHAHRMRGLFWSPNADRLLFFSRGVRGERSRVNRGAYVCRHVLKEWDVRRGKGVELLAIEDGEQMWQWQSNVCSQCCYPEVEPIEGVAWSRDERMLALSLHTCKIKPRDQKMERRRHARDCDHGWGIYYSELSTGRATALSRFVKNRVRVLGWLPDSSGVVFVQYKSRWLYVVDTKGNVRKAVEAKRIGLLPMHGSMWNGCRKLVMCFSHDQLSELRRIGVLASSSTANEYRGVSGLMGKVCADALWLVCEGPQRQGRGLQKFIRQERVVDIGLSPVEAKFAYVHLRNGVGRIALASFEWLRVDLEPIPAE